MANTSLHYTHLYYTANTSLHCTHLHNTANTLLNCTHFHFPSNTSMHCIQLHKCTIVNLSLTYFPTFGDLWLIKNLPNKVSTTIRYNALKVLSIKKIVFPKLVSLVIWATKKYVVWIKKKKILSLQKWLWKYFFFKCVVQSLLGSIQCAEQSLHCSFPYGVHITTVSGLHPC